MKSIEKKIPIGVNQATGYLHHQRKPSFNAVQHVNIPLQLSSGCCR